MTQTDTNHHQISHKRRKNKKSHLFSIEPKLSSGLMPASQNVILKKSDSNPVIRISPVCVQPVPMYVQRLLLATLRHNLYTTPRGGRHRNYPRSAIGSKETQRLSLSCGLCGFVCWYWVTTAQDTKARKLCHPDIWWSVWQCSARKRMIWKKCDHRSQLMWNKQAKAVNKEHHTPLCNRSLRFS